MTDTPSNDHKDKRSSGKDSEPKIRPGDEDVDDGRLDPDQARELNKTLRSLQPKLDLWLKANRGSIWDGPAKLIGQFSKLIIPLTYVMGLLIFSVLITDPSKLPWMDSSPSSSHTAYVTIKGTILTGDDADADKIIPAMEKALESKGSEALILRINSPGGSPVQSDRMYEAINALREKHGKPIYTVIEDIGASGAYYIASATDAIYANPSSMIGSIGVISSSFGFTDLMDKLGVQRRVFTAGESKSMMDPFSPIKPGIKEHWEKILASTHDTFIERVKAGRGEALTGPESTLFSGLIWDAQTAKDYGLIDDMGSLRSVAANVVGAPEIVDYSPPKRFQGLGAGMGVDSSDIEDAVIGVLSGVQSKLETPHIKATP